MTEFTRRTKVLRVPVWHLMCILKGTHRLVMEEGIPEDARVLSIDFDPWDFSIKIFLESKEFDEIPGTILVSQLMGYPDLEEISENVSNEEDEQKDPSP